MFFNLKKNVFGSLDVKLTNLLVQFIMYGIKSTNHVNYFWM